MKEILPENLIKLAEKCSFPLYVVGGRVRDYLAGFTPEKPDTDICAPASAEEFSHIAESCGFTVQSVYRHTGTVKLTCGKDGFEFACFRSDGYIRGEHVPAETFFTDDINLDAIRRDFKCNAVYYDIAAGKFCDPLGGIEDIKKRRLSTVADPRKVFGEDGLRLMRLARIAAQTGFAPIDDCLAGAAENAALIEDVSIERVFTELDLLLHADKKYGVEYGHYKGLKVLEKTGVLKFVLPELHACAGIEQRADFHKYDVLEHSLKACAYSDGSVRLAALLHDIGKGYCFKNSGNFIGHETESARMATEILTRLKAPKKLIEETARLISLHMYDFRCDAKENKIRKFIIANYDILDKELLLKQADFSACKDDFSPAPSVVKISGIYKKMEEEGVPMTLKALKVKGNDLKDAGFIPEYIGDALERLLYDCAIKCVPNDEARLIGYAQKIMPDKMRPEFR